jgi:hypothetical protein
MADNNGMMLFNNQDATQIIDNSTDIEIAQAATHLYNTKIAATRQDDDIIKKMAIYTDGYPVIVKYFKKLESYLNKQTADITIPLNGPDCINKAYDMINNMEMKFESEIAFDANVDNLEWNIAGTGTLYSGVDPHLGDFFLYNLDATTLGLFIINEVTPLTIHEYQMFAVSFSFEKVVDLTLYETLQQCVINTFEFDRETFFNSEYALLTSDEYKDKEESNHTIDTMVSDLILTYYDEDTNRTFMTTMNGSAIYDPFIIEFYNSLIPDTAGLQRPTQLFTQYMRETFRKTILAKLLEKVNLRPVKYKYIVVGTYLRQYYDTIINGLINRAVLCVYADGAAIANKGSIFGRSLVHPGFQVEDNPETYIFSNGFYDLMNNIAGSDVTTLDPFEQAVYYAYTNNFTDTTKTIIKEAILDAYPFNDVDEPLRMHKLILSIYVLKCYIANIQKVIQ